MWFSKNLCPLISSLALLLVLCCIEKGHSDDALLILWRMGSRLHLYKLGPVLQSQSCSSKLLAPRGKLGKQSASTMEGRIHQQGHLRSRDRRIESSGTLLRLGRGSRLAVQLDMVQVPKVAVAERAFGVVCRKPFVEMGQFSFHSLHTFFLSVCNASSRVCSHHT